MTKKKSTPSRQGTRVRIDGLDQKLVRRTLQMVTVPITLGLPDRDVLMDILSKLRTLAGVAVTGV